MLVQYCGNEYGISSFGDRARDSGIPPRAKKRRRARRDSTDQMFLYLRLEDQYRIINVEKVVDYGLDHVPVVY